MSESKKRPEFPDFSGLNLEEQIKAVEEYTRACDEYDKEQVKQAQELMINLAIYKGGFKK